MSDIQNIVNVSRSFESILLEKEERSRKTAWRVAAAGLVLAAMAIAAIIILLPLKTSDTELWSVDKQTGRYEYMTRVKERDIAAEKALAHSLAAHYVRLREGYNYFSLQRDYDDVQLFNSDSVNRDYLDGFNGDQAPDVIFNKAEYVVDIAIISNVHAPATGGTVKLTRFAYNLWNGYSDKSCTPYDLFDCSFAPYMYEAVKLRYPEYTRQLDDMVIDDVRN